MKGEVIDWVKVPQIIVRHDYKLQDSYSVKLKTSGLIDSLVSSFVPDLSSGLLCPHFGQYIRVSSIIHNNFQLRPVVDEI